MDWLVRWMGWWMDGSLLCGLQMSDMMDGFLDR